MKTPEELDELAITTLRTLAIDAVEAAGSGYPGTAMALSPVLYTIFTEHLRYDPEDPEWENRDRFILEVGHASILLHSMLHLGGVSSVDPDTGERVPARTLNDLRHYRQGNTAATGHPEHGVTAGIDASTGPLSQGLATSVGMAMAQRWKQATFDPEGAGLFDHEVITLGSDGGMMEGLSYEAASLAGHHGLSNLCWIYDRNGISIEGSTDIAFTEDIAARFEALGWRVVTVDDANDRQALLVELAAFRSEAERPTLIIVHSIIGFGSPKYQGMQRMHGMPLGPEEVAATKAHFGWPADSSFLVPDDVAAHVQQKMADRGNEVRTSWDNARAEYGTRFPDRAASLEKMERSELPENWDKGLHHFEADPEGCPTRVTGGLIIEAIGANLPWLIGGAADVGPQSATFPWLPIAGSFQPATPAGRNMHYGVREHAMAAISNGLALSGLRPFDAMYLVFSDYARGAIRQAALMKLPVIHVLTHDSIQVGGDGPTHQPVEQLAGYRATPNLVVIRPADANEVSYAWKVALERTTGPTVLSLSYQPIPVLDRSNLAGAEMTERGGYVISDPPDGAPPAGIIIATGGEVHVALAAQAQLAENGIAVRVVNMTSWELFDAQPDEYRSEVLPAAISKRLAVEEGATIGWHRYVGDAGRVLGVDTFGMSAPTPMMQKQFGFTPEHVASEMVNLLSDSSES